MTMESLNAEETPPLTRRKLEYSPTNRTTRRNTSAHAEKTCERLRAKNE